MSTFIVSFNLKSPYKGDAVPIVYGNCNELGNGEPTQGIEFIHDEDSSYNYHCKIRFSGEINERSIWYSYCFRPSYGSIILENAPRRYLPQIQLLQPPKTAPTISLYDVIDEITPIGDLVLHFRVRCFTQYGQHLYIVGSDESLGKWDPRKAVQLFYEGNKDYWTCHVKIPLKNVPKKIEYKYFRSFVPKLRKNQQKGERRSDISNQSQDVFNKPQENSRINTYKDMYKDFYRSKNKSLFYGQNSNNRNANFRRETQNETREKKSESNEDQKVEFDLNGIEWEPSEVSNHKIEFEHITSPSALEIVDTFRWSDPELESLTRSLFSEAANRRSDAKVTTSSSNSNLVLNDKKPGIVSVRFEVLCPNIQKHQDLYIVGSNKELGNWKFENGFKLDDSNFPLFVGIIEMKRSSFPFEYKFVVLQDEMKEYEIEIDDESPLSKEELVKLEELKEEELKKDKEKVIDEEKLIKSMNRKTKIFEKRIEKAATWEPGENRYCSGITSQIISNEFPSTLLINAWFINPNKELLKKFGVSIPLFSLRSNDSLGIGQYGDIRSFSDFCSRIDSSVIDFPLPLFDTNTAVIGKIIDCFQQKDKNLLYLSPSFEDQLSKLIPDSNENPYNVVSGFALHPVYINLFDIILNMPKDISDDINRTKWELEKLNSVNYKVVYGYKMTILWRIYKEVVVVDKIKSDPTSKEFDYSTFYQSKRGALLLDDNFDEFVLKESFWIYQYALFCFFREKYQSSSFKEWPDEISNAFTNSDENDGKRSEVIQKLIEVANDLSNKGEAKFDLTFFLWIQYVCYSQFNKSKKYALEHRIGFKGVFPMNVVPNSADCWSSPFLFHNHNKFRSVVVTKQPNAATTQMIPLGDESGCVFASFDWNLANKETKEYWNQRINCISSLFNAIKIDSALDLYRSWEINTEKSVTACLGHFYPCDPISSVDLESRQLNNIERYTHPYVKKQHLSEIFGQKHVESIISKFFDKSETNDCLQFKPEFDNERKLYELFKKSRKSVINGIDNVCLFENLIKIADDVLLIEDEERPGKYYVRSNFFNEPQIALKQKNDMTLLLSRSFMELSEVERRGMKDLYDYYTYMRHNENWLRHSREKLNVFNLNLLICVDDNEIKKCGSLSYEIRDSISKQLHSLSVLSLRVQRISRNNSSLFGDPGTFEYLSVSSPSLHNTSPLRLWWEENHKNAQSFCEQRLSMNEKVPDSLECEIHEKIFSQNLWSGSELAIFLLQDIVGIIPFFRKQSPKEERITPPLENGKRIKNNYQSEYSSFEDECRIKYRVAYYINELLKNEEISTKLKKLVRDSHRIDFQDLSFMGFE